MSVSRSMAVFGVKMGTYLVNHPESWPVALPLAAAVGVAYGGYRLYKHIADDA